MTRRVIDFHTHLAYRAGPVADAVFAANGVTTAVRLTVRPSGEALRAILAESAAMKTRVLVFAGVPWGLVDDPDFGALAAEDLHRSVTAGARGLKISKALGLGVRTADGHLLAVDDPRLDPLWRAAGELGVPVAIHTGDPVAFFQPVDDHNERIEELRAHPTWSFYGEDYPSLEELLAARDRMVARHPETTFVAVHVGGLAEDIDAVARSMRALPNLWIDIAARVPELGRHDPQKVRAFFMEMKDRILFGTDIQISRDRVVLGSGDPRAPAPGLKDAERYYDVHWRYLETDDRQFEHATPVQGRWKIDGIDLPRDVLAAIYHGNAERLLKLDGP